MGRTLFRIRPQVVCSGRCRRSPHALVFADGDPWASLSVFQQASRRKVSLWAMKRRNLHIYMHRFRVGDYQTEPAPSTSLPHSVRGIRCTYSTADLVCSTELTPPCREDSFQGSHVCCSVNMTNLRRTHGRFHISYLRLMITRHHVAEDLGAALNALLLLAEQCSIDLAASVQLKLQLNARKYPASLVKGKAEKYDAYCATTGFGKGSKQVGWMFASGPTVVSW